MGPEHIRLLAEVVAAREAARRMAPGHTRFVAVVETPDALPLLAGIAKADPRVAAIGIGAEDLSTELEAVPGADLLYHFGMMVVAAARAAGISPWLVGPFAYSRTSKPIAPRCAAPAPWASPAKPASIRLR